MVSRLDSKSIHPLLNQKKPHPRHEVLVSKKNFHYFKLFHCIPYELIFLKKLRYKKNRTHMKKLGHTSYLLNFRKLQKSEFWKNKQTKKLLEILSFYTCVPKITIIWSTVPEIRRMKKWNFQKKPKKVPGSTTILHRCTKNYDWMIHSFWDMVRDRWMDRQADRKSDI